MKTLALMAQIIELADRTKHPEERMLLIGEAAGILSITHQALVQGMTDEQIDGLMPNERRERLRARVLAENTAHKEASDIAGRLNWIQGRKGEAWVEAVKERAGTIAMAAGRAWASRDDVDQAHEELEEEAEAEAPAP